MRDRLVEDVSSCQGIHGDNTVSVVVTPQNVRELIDTQRPGFIQSRLRCLGSAPVPISGPCDEPTIRQRLRCAAADFRGGLSELLPYAKVMLGPLMDCHQQNVLVLGLGGGTIPSFLRTKCPGSHVVAVDNNANVVRAARDFFAFDGEAIVDDVHRVLSKLSTTKAGTFDAIVTDVGHNIRLDRKDLGNVVRLLKSDGVLMENLSTPSFADEQVALYKDFLGDVSAEVSGNNRIVFGRLHPSKTLEQ